MKTITNTQTIEKLQKRCQQLEKENAELTAKVNWLLEQFRLSQHRRYGLVNVEKEKAIVKL